MSLEIPYCMMIASILLNMMDVSREFLFPVPGACLSPDTPAVRKFNTPGAVKMLMAAFFMA